MFNLAIEREWLEVNPAWRMPKPGGKERGRDRVLIEPEIREVWEASTGERPAMATLVKLEVLTRATERRAGQDATLLAYAPEADGAVHYFEIGDIWQRIEPGIDFGE